LHKNALSRFYTKLLPNAALRNYSAQCRLEMDVMATNATIIKNGACLYGLRFGCVNTTNDPNCNRCVERLANAVNSVLRPTAKKSVESFQVITCELQRKEARLESVSRGR